MGNINVMSGDITKQLKSGLEETQFNFLEERKHLTSRYQFIRRSVAGIGLPMSNHQNHDKEGKEGRRDSNFHDRRERREYDSSMFLSKFLEVVN